MPTILDQIVAAKREEIVRAKRAVSEDAVPAACRRGAAAARFLRPGLAAWLPDRPTAALIAEVKKASPSKGVIRGGFRPVEIARTYQQHGAACLSVLTDEPYFQGSLDYLRADPRRGRHARCCARTSSRSVPGARGPGGRGRCRAADRRVPRRRATEDAARRDRGAGHDAAGRAVRAGASAPRAGRRGRLIGVNNRNLRTFEVDLEHTLRLRRQIPADRAVVGESGIRTRADVCDWPTAGVAGHAGGRDLDRVGQDIGAAVDALLGRA